MAARNEVLDRGNLFSKIHTALAGITPKAVWSHRPSVRRQAGPCSGKTGSTCVLHLIQASEKGVHPAVLSEMTGYDRPRLDKILQRLFRRGQIMVGYGGLYTEAKPLHFEA